MHRRATSTVCAIALLALLPACGASEVSSTTTASSSSSTGAASTAFGAATTAAALPIPSAAELDNQIKSALDPDLPDDDRLVLIEDGEVFRSSIPDLYEALRENPAAKYMVVDPVFDNRDGTLTATFKLDKDGSATAVRTATVHFVSVDGMWKISRTDLCGILRSADYRTPACG